MAQEQSAAEAANYLPVRNDWLARRKEPILEPDLPIIDPHHHLWDRERLALPARRTAGRYQQRPQHRRDRVRAGARDASRRRPGGDAAGRRDRVRQRRRRHERERHLRQDPRLRRHRRARRPDARRRASSRCWRRTCAPAAGASAASATSPPGTPIRTCAIRAIRRRPECSADAKFREGFAVLARLGLSFDAWLYHPQIDELTSLADAFPDTKIVLNHCGGPVGINAYKRDEVFPGWKKSIEALAQAAERLREARRARHAHRAATASRSFPSRRPRRRSPTRGGPTSRPASRRSAPSRACSKATSRSTRARTATRCSGTPASCWRRARAQPRRPTCSSGLRSGFISSTASADCRILATCPPDAVIWLAGEPARLVGCEEHGDPRRCRPADRCGRAACVRPSTCRDRCRLLRCRARPRSRRRPARSRWTRIVARPSSVASTRVERVDRALGGGINRRVRHTRCSARDRRNIDHAAAVRHRSASTASRRRRALGRARSCELALESASVTCSMRRELR